MAKFAISMSAVVEADSLDEAYRIQKSIMDKMMDDYEEVQEVYEIDVEQQDGFEDEEE